MPIVRIVLQILRILIPIAFLSACSTSDGPPRILVFTLTKGWHHSSIPAGNRFFLELGKQKEILVDTTTNPRRFNEEYLKTVDAVVFLNTTGDVLNRNQEIALERFIQAGGSYIGIHSASDTEYEWPWYGKLVGAYFENHPEIQTARLFSPDSAETPLRNGIPKSFSIEDEWYNYISTSISAAIHPFLFLDESSYTGGKNGAIHPAAWYQNFDGGKSFYTVLGHREETYQNPIFRKLMDNALNWALDHDPLDYSNATSEQVPDEDRFMKSTLASQLDEPMELAVEPSGNVWVIGRKGQVWLWDATGETFSLKQTLDVWTKYEDGLLGITLDRNFAQNHWAYVFYSPNIPESIQRVSRFTIRGDTLDRTSEKILLTIPVQRTECCHSGGSLTMDQNGDLWISTGDNTNPHKSDGYAPIDERADRGPFDAQKSSSNSNDLRGKVLRIHPESHGGYTIPEGNLFPPGTPGTRPEIYTMGCRNPFRISVRPDGQGLAWGDVGPDAGKDSVYGPRGFDEINLTYTPGFFGWPYFIANNIPYTNRNFADSIPAGTRFDTRKPVINNSPLNTGTTKLPLPKPAWLYYSYKPSEEFPEVGKGGRTAMAGPWIPKGGKGVKLPSYYGGKILVYDWMRGWVFAATPDPGKKPQLERVLTRFRLSKPMDMELGPDGYLYVLEYGENWFAANPDARLSRIEYSLDNHAPVARMEANPTIGGAPLRVRFSAATSFDDDPGDSLSYEWRISSASVVNSRQRDYTHTFTASGTYTVRLVVTDREGKSAATSTQIKVGNYPPRISIFLKGNSSFFWPGNPVEYDIKVEDKEDGSTTTGTIPGSEVFLHQDILNETEDQTTQAQGHQSQSIESQGKALIAGSDCKSCHQEKVRSAGPAYLEVAQRYRGKPNAVSTLAAKIIRGGAGNWGDHAMSAHPQLPLEDAKKMVTYILSLQQKEEKSLVGTKGRIQTPPLKEGDQWLLTAQYRDKGAPGVESIEGRQTLTLHHPRINAQSAGIAKGSFAKNNYGKAPFFMRMVSNRSLLGFENLDLTGISAVRVHGNASGEIPLKLEICLDKPDAPAVGTVPVVFGKNPLDFSTQQTSLPPLLGKHTMYFRLTSEGLFKRNCEYRLEWVEFVRK